MSETKLSRFHSDWGVVVRWRPVTSVRFRPKAALRGGQQTANSGNQISRYAGAVHGEPLLPHSTEIQEHLSLCHDHYAFAHTRSRLAKAILFHRKQQPQQFPQHLGHCKKASSWPMLDHYHNQILPRMSLEL